MIIVGNIEEGGIIPVHQDENDYANALLSIGTDRGINDGCTIYYDGVDQHEKEIFRFPFKHFSNITTLNVKILHSKQTHFQYCCKKHRVENIFHWH